MAENPLILVVAPATNSSNEEDQYNESLLKGAHSHLRVHFLRTNFPSVSRNLWINGLKNIFRLRSTISEIRKLQKLHQPEAIVFILHEPTLPQILLDSLLLSATRRLFPCTIVHLQGANLAEGYEQLPAMAKKSFLKAFSRPNLAIAPSNSARKGAEFLEAQTVETIHAGVTDVWPDGPRRERNIEPVILCLGTISEESGIGTLLEACKLLHDRGLKFRCRIAGPASTSEVLAEFQKQASSLGNIVTISGPISGDRKWDLIAESDIFCRLPHQTPEPIDRNVLEAMMSGLPVVASHWQSLPEVVSEGKSGFVVPVRDAKSAAERLAKLIKDQLLRQIMGNSGRNRYLDQHTLEASQQRWENAVLAAIQSTKV
jgi:glycosyltransferase involved in cell wall biosynthesis